MSNINQNNFNNCFNLRLSNSDYWDLFICNDCGCDIDHASILDACRIVDININNDKCIDGDSLCSLVSWTEASLPKKELILNDIGLTGIDNGFITYDCSESTTSSSFIDTFTGSSLTITSANTNFCFTRVTGCTYDYDYQYVTSGNSVGRYAELCGGFYQGFFKLSDRTFFKDISNNMFVWPMDWFTCPPDCPTTGTTTGSTTGSTCCGGGCGNSNCQLCGTILDDGTGGCGPWCTNCDGKGDGKGGCCPNPRKAFECYNKKEPKKWDYQILPTRYEEGWTAEFWMRRNPENCSGSTGNILNKKYPNNEGFFYYMGTRAENKFWDVFSGESGYTTSSGYPLPPPEIKEKKLLDNPFLVYQPVGCCCFSGVTTVITQERDKNADIVNNALGFRIKSNGTIGYRSLGVSGECKTVTATTISNCNEQCDCDDCGAPCNCQLCGTILDNGTGGCGDWCEDCGTSGGCCNKGRITATTVTEQYVTGVTINEEYSEHLVVPKNEWIQLVVKFCAYEGYIGCELNGVPRRKGKLSFYVNGLLKYTIDDFDEFLFRDLFEYREKQEGVPFNYSLGGGTQGLLDSNTIGGPDPLDKDLFIQKYFAGTFIGDISRFSLYECCLDVTTIRYRFQELCTDYGICPISPNCYLLTEDGLIIESETGGDLLLWCNE